MADELKTAPWARRRSDKAPGGETHQVAGDGIEARRRRAAGQR